MRIDVWSDIVCPWCYLGKRRLELALEDFPHRDQVEVHYRSFQLNPNSPELADEPIVEMLARKYNSTPEAMRQQNRRLVDLGAEAGLTYKMDKLRESNSFNAHRLIKAAAAAGGLELQAKVKNRFMQGYFGEEEVTGRAEVLGRLAVDAGMAEALVARVLESDEYTTEVNEDIRTASEYGISGVPFFLFEGKWAVSGAQSVETFKAALNEVWENLQNAG